MRAVPLEFSFGWAARSPKYLLRAVKTNLK